MAPDYILHTGQLMYVMVMFKKGVVATARFKAVLICPCQLAVFQY